MQILSLLKTLKSRLISLLVLVALPGVATIFLQSEDQKNQAISNAQIIAETVSSSLTRQQHSIIDETRNFLSHLSEQPQIQNPSAPECSEYLAGVLSLTRAYVNLGVPRADGELLCNALPLKKRVNVADRGYIRRAMDNRAFSIGELQLDRAAETTSVNMAYPVISDDNELLGAAVAVVSLGWWSTELSKFNLPMGSVAYITDAEGSVVASYLNTVGYLGDSANLDSKIHRPGLVTGNDNIRRYTRQTDLYITPAGRAVSMSIGIPVEREIAAAERKFVHSIVLFLMTLSVIFLIAVIGLKRSILEPLQQLTDAISSLSKGELVQLKADKGSTELIKLKELFSEMAEKRLSAERSAVARSEELNSVFSALPDIYFRIDSESLILDYKADHESDLYVDQDQFLKKKVVDLLPPEFGEKLMYEIGFLSAADGYRSWEFALDFEDGKKIFEARLKRIGNTEQYIMVVRNITDRKKAEESLQLSDTVFRSISESIMITDPDGIIIDVNPAFTQTTGYGLEDVKGKTPAVLKSGRHEQEFYQAFWQQLNKTGKWQGEMYNRRKNGEIYPQWMTVNTVSDKRGEPVQRVALFIDFSEKKRTEELIWRQAHLDALTELPNRKLLNDRLLQEIQHSDRSGLSTALLFLDLDRFKEVNDTLGHAVGDQLLIQVAQRIKECVRSVDTVARQGGDEFTVILSQVKNPHIVDRICEKLLARISEPYVLGEESAYISASIGITFYPDDVDSADNLIKAADQAMYVAKSEGRNRFQYFTQDMQDEALLRMQRISDMRTALIQHQFELYYQPIVNLNDRSVIKAEALLRWHHPEHGVVYPDEFIRLAEETYQINEIGRWVLEQAISAVQKIQAELDPGFQISINVSPVQFLAMDNHLDNWVSSLESKGLEAGSVVAEITEGVMMDPTSETREKLIAFRDAGVEVALDDFGTGYSSLSYISEYDIDYLKIDQYFISRLSKESDAYSLCNAIIVMAHNLGIKVIAEGIETEEQYQLLQELNCDYGQGYLFARPMTFFDLTRLLEQEK